MNKETFIEKYAVERKGTHSLKWDALDERFGDPDLLAMWVADMDFKVADSITNALQERVDHAVYGYTVISDDYYQAFSNWMETHFNLTIPKEWVRFSAGVVQALLYAIKCYTKENEAVMIQTPVYYPFHDVVNNTKRKLIKCPLIYNEGDYEMDFDRFEQLIVDHNVKMYLHCSPHNPAGKVWTEEESIKLLDICQKHQVLVFSDEIHQDFIFGNQTFIPAFKIKEGAYQSNVITATSASKTFNLASFTHSHVMIADKKLRAQYDEFMKSEQDFNANAMSVIATQAAYEGGQDWLDHIKEIIIDNYNHLKTELHEKAPEIVVSNLEGTYLVMLDLNPILNGMTSKEFIQDRCKIAIDYGEWFGEEYTGFIRLNLATHPKYVQTAIDRIVREVEAIKSRP